MIFANNKHIMTIISQTSASREDLLYVIFPPNSRSIGGVRKLANTVGTPMKDIPMNIPFRLEEKIDIFSPPMPNALTPTTADNANEKKTLTCQFGDLNTYLDRSERLR